MKQRRMNSTIEASERIIYDAKTGDIDLHAPLSGEGRDNAVVVCNICGESIEVTTTSTIREDE